MAGIDQDNFSNVSWHSDQNAGATGSRRSTSEAPEAEEVTGRDGRSELEQTAARLESQHQQREEAQPGLSGTDSVLGGGTLDCTVGSPIKENDGAKDAFVSYQITTTVSLAAHGISSGSLLTTPTARQAFPSSRNL
jgi:sorting nexin-4